MSRVIPFNRSKFQVELKLISPGDKPEHTIRFTTESPGEVYDIANKYVSTITSTERVGENVMHEKWYEWIDTEYAPNVPWRYRQELSTFQICVTRIIEFDTRKLKHIIKFRNPQGGKEKIEWVDGQEGNRVVVDILSGSGPDALGFTVNTSFGNLHRVLCRCDALDKYDNEVFEGGIEVATLLV